MNDHEYLTASLEERRQRQRRASCAAVARSLVGSNCLVLDTESTGLGAEAEAVEVSVIDAQAQVLLNTLIRPLSTIPEEATAIHGIKNEDVAGAPSWAAVHDEFCQLIAGRPVVIYNADYDIEVLRQTMALHGLSMPEIDARCAMHLYACWFGVLRADGSYRFQKLGAAAQQCGIVVNEAHRALADCMTTLGIIRHMAGV